TAWGPPTPPAPAGRPARSGATPAGTPRRAGSASRSPRPSSRFLLRVAVLHVDLPAARPQRLAERRRDRHGSVAAARAADPDRQVRLALGIVEPERVVEKPSHPRQQLLRARVLEHVPGDLVVEA